MLPKEGRTSVSCDLILSLLFLTIPRLINNNKNTINPDTATNLSRSVVLRNYCMLFGWSLELSSFRVDLDARAASPYPSEFVRAKGPNVKQRAKRCATPTSTRP